VLLFSALILAAAVIWGARAISGEIAAARKAAAGGRVLEVLGLFAPAISAVDNDPRALLVWQPLARTARQLLPDAFASIDRAAGATFPFSADRIQAAHARWTADWLAWERSHDAEYKLKATVAENELGAGGPLPARLKLEAVEREKLDLYQRRYEEYVRVAKALQALLE
jgi:hypothetical protein